MSIIANTAMLHCHINLLHATNHRKLLITKLKKKAHEHEGPTDNLVIHMSNLDSRTSVHIAMSPTVNT